MADLPAGPPGMFDSFLIVGVAYHFALVVSEVAQALIVDTDFNCSTRY